MSNASMDLSHNGLYEARQLLRERQAEVPTVASPVGTSTLALALTKLDERRCFKPTGFPDLVMRDGLKFNRKMEEKRILLAEDLVRRVNPGPFEDPTYLALLAYQAASIELALPGKNIKGEPVDWGWSKFLLGTVHSPEVNAFSWTIKSHGYTIVWVLSALIEFAYQAAKAVVALQAPTKSAAHESFVSTNISAEHIAAQLEKDQEPAERLYRTLEAYFFTKGYPRAFSSETVPVEHALPLTLLINMTERWIIAHEYGHGFAAKMNWKHIPDENQEWAEEYFADNNATIITALSAAKLDRVPPEFAMIGGTLALACLEVLRRGMSIIRFGTVLEDKGDDEHPPNESRAMNILRAFKLVFEPHPGSQSIDLKLSSIMKLAASDTKAAEMNERVLQFPNTLFGLWKHVQPRLLKDFETKRPLHAIWDTSGQGAA